MCHSLSVLCVYLCVCVYMNAGICSIVWPLFCLHCVYVCLQGCDFKCLCRSLCWNKLLQLYSSFCCCSFFIHFHMIFFFRLFFNISPPPPSSSPLFLIITLVFILFFLFYFHLTPPPPFPVVIRSSSFLVSAFGYFFMCLITRKSRGGENKVT